MDSSRKGPQTRRSKRQAEGRKAPYARPDDASNTPTTTENKANTPYWRKRLVRFINPWYSGGSGSDEDNDHEANEKHTEEATTSTQQQDDLDLKITSSSLDNLTSNLDRDNDEDNKDQQIVETMEVEIKETTEIVAEVEMLDTDEDLHEPTHNSQSTLVAPSLDHDFTPEGSAIDDTEETRRHQEREDSLIASGQDSDTAGNLYTPSSPSSNPQQSSPSRKKRDARSSTPKRDSRSSTPVRSSTRRTTRSQAAREASVDEEEVVFPVVENIAHAPAEIDLIQEEMESSEPPEPVIVKEEEVEEEVQPKEQPSSKSKNKKKKKKGKKTSVTEDAKELEQELTGTDVRLAEKLRRSQELIDESDALLQETVQQDEAVAEVLQHHTDNPFAEDQDDQDGDQVGEDDEQTFHSTTQFVQADDDEIDYEEEKYYSSEGESRRAEDDEEEDADTVKYYPPEPTFDDQDEDEAQQIDEDDDEVQFQQTPRDEEQERDEVEALETTYSIESPDFSGKSPSPAAAESVPETHLMETEEYEFSPMQSRAATPRYEVSTPSGTDRFVDCPPIVTPQADRVAKSDTNMESAQWTGPMRPTDSIAVLADFFGRKKGQFITPAQAEFCRQLIDEAVLPTKSKTPELREDTRPSSAARQIAPVIPSQSTATTVMRASTPSATSIPRVAPFAVKRQAIGDLYHETISDSKESAESPLAPLDEYLEIKRYEGVEWDSLPNYIKVRRFLEWKGTEPPEVVKRRKIEETRKMKERNAAVWGRDRQEAVADGAEASGKTLSLKRMASTSGMMSDDDYEDDDAALTRKTASTKAVTSALPVAAAVAAVETAITTIEGTLRPSSVAQKLLNIVGKGSKDDDEPRKDSKASESSTPLQPSLATATTFSAPPALSATPAPSFSVPAPFAGSASVSSSGTSGGIFSLPAAKPTFSFGTSTTSNDKPATKTNETSETSSSPFSFATPATSFKAPAPVEKASTSLFATPATAVAKVGSKEDTLESTKPALPTFSFGLPASAGPAQTTSSSSPFGLGSVSKDSAKSDASPWGMPLKSGFEATVPATQATTSITANKNDSLAFSSSSASALASSPGTSTTTFGANPASAFGSSAFGQPFGQATASSSKISSTPPVPKTFSFGLPPAATATASTSESSPKSSAAPPSLAFNFDLPSKASSPRTAETTANNWGFGSTSAFGTKDTPASSFGIPTKATASSASINPFAAFTASKLGSKTDNEKEEGAKVIELSDDEDNEDKENEDPHSGGEKQYDDEDGGYSYDDQEDEGSYDDEDGFYEEDEEDPYEGEAEALAEGSADEDGDDEGHGADEDQGSRGSSQPPRASSPIFTSRGAAAAAQEATGSQFGQTTTTTTSSAFGSSGTSSFSPFGFPSSKTTVTSRDQQSLRTPEFNFEFGASAGRSTIAQPGSPLQNKSASSSSLALPPAFGQTSSTLFSTKTEGFSSGVPAFGSSGGFGGFGSAPSFGSEGAGAASGSFMAKKGGEEVVRGLPASDLSEYETAPIICEEEGFYTEDGTLSPLASPVISPRSLPGSV